LEAPGRREVYNVVRRGESWLLMLGGAPVCRAFRGQVDAYFRCYSGI
jgi:hypothetical protein